MKYVENYQLMWNMATSKCVSSPLNLWYWQCKCLKNDTFQATGFFIWQSWLKKSYFDPTIKMDRANIKKVWQIRWYFEFFDKIIHFFPSLICKCYIVCLCGGILGSCNTHIAFQASKDDTQRVEKWAHIFFFDQIFLAIPYIPIYYY